MTVKVIGAGLAGCEAAYQLAKQVGVEMPITERIYEVIQGEITAAEALEMLMGRDKRCEAE